MGGCSSKAVAVIPTRGGGDLKQGRAGLESEARATMPDAQLV